jgi:hypothetical protein
MVLHCIARSISLKSADRCNMASDVGFYCVPEAQSFHVGLSIFVLIIGLCLPWVDSEFRGVPIRTIMFAFLVFLGLFPAFHWYSITPLFFREKLFGVGGRYHIAFYVTIVILTLSLCPML